MKKYIFILLAVFMFAGCKKVQEDAAAVNATLPSESITRMETVSEEVSTSLEVTETEQTTAFETEQTVSETEQTQAETTAVSDTAVSVGGDVEVTTSEISETSVETSKTEITYIDGILVANKTYALPSDYAPGVSSEAQAAFDAMQADAAAMGLNIYISSAYRSYDYQTGLYQRYVEKSGQAEADRYSARPGHSEHQTGLAFDLNTISDEFKDTAEGKWVAENCHEYGFIIRYPEDKESVTGYMYEPWHIRYLGVETATAVYNSGLCLEEYLGITSEYAE